MKIWFDLANLYYWPQYEPVYNELQARGHDCHIVVYQQNDTQALLRPFIAKLDGHAISYDIITSEQAVPHYNSHHPDWIICGNDNINLESALISTIKTALLYHGIGVKSSYFRHTMAQFDVRFTEGRFLNDTLQSLYPDNTFECTGFAKLDPLFIPKASRHHSLNHNTLECPPHRPTLLYAPTFFPSSLERMPRNWPASLSDCNIIIKPHFFTWSKARYARQRTLLKHWRTFDNVHIAPADALSLVPYMAAADMLISEASSALFEFAALDKPIVWLDYLKLRWSYRGPFRYRFKKRMTTLNADYRDVAAHVATPKQLIATVRDQLNHPYQFQTARQRAARALVGLTDGHVSERVADYLENMQV